MYEPDVWHPWTNKSEHIPFKSTTTAVGNGEYKTSAELDINTSVGGQNSVFDLDSPEYGHISVKDMTSDDCRLGADSLQDCSELVERVSLLYRWSRKYEGNIRADEVYEFLHPSIVKIYRREICGTLCTRIEQIMEKMKLFMNAKVKCTPFKSELFIEAFSGMEHKTFKNLMNEIAKKEAIYKTLIIVHMDRGFQVVKNLNRISCTRITQGTCRIKVSP